MAVAWCGVWLVAVELWRGWWRRGPGVGGGVVRGGEVCGFVPLWLLWCFVVLGVVVLFW